jgi:hypothetical protein
MSESTELALNPFVEVQATQRVLNSGVQYEFKFRNGWGASVVRHEGSYGHEAGLWELAVLDRAGNINYSTPVTNDVIDWLDVEGVRATLLQIAELPPCLLTPIAELPPSELESGW